MPAKDKQKPAKKLAATDRKVSAAKKAADTGKKAGTTAKKPLAADEKPYAEALGPVEVPISVVTQTIRRLIDHGLLDEFERRCGEDATVTASAKATNLAKEFLERTGSRRTDSFVAMTLGPSKKNCPPGYRCPRAK